MSNFEKISLQLQAIPESAGEIRRKVRESAATVGFNSEALYDLLVGIGEAFNNAVQHGNAVNNGGIEASISANHEEIVVVLNYIGEGFVHEIPSASETYKLGSGGLGRFLMYSLLDEVKYTILDGHTYVRLTKRKSAS